MKKNRNRALSDRRFQRLYGGIKIIDGVQLHRCLGIDKSSKHGGTISTIFMTYKNFFSQQFNVRWSWDGVGKVSFMIYVLGLLLSVKKFIILEPTFRGNKIFYQTSFAISTLQELSYKRLRIATYS